MKYILTLTLIHLLNILLLKCRLLIYFNIRAHILKHKYHVTCYIYGVNNRLNLGEAEELKNNIRDRVEKRSGEEKLLLEILGERYKRKKN